MFTNAGEVGVAQNLQFMKSKYLLLAGAVLVVLSFWTWYCVNAMIGFPAGITQISPSGRYILENVRVGKIFPFGGMAYLRVIDRENPQVVYRTPLYDTQSLDMNTNETESTVGIVWIYFDRNKKSFEIAMPEWEESWMNMFISNTPYTHLEN
ncbi:hypothetical protein [Pseudomonas sp. B35(2017)]|uniref:hypothetical protein n=1 Tax=Pseudomonas sp. B35(2017) TaxID=1981722 RepID=UPI00111C658B|nr:hypothetical protein [Pseudomonas sp. B35(2017)]